MPKEGDDDGEDAMDFSKSDDIADSLFDGTADDETEDESDKGSKDDDADETEDEDSEDDDADETKDEDSEDDDYEAPLTTKPKKGAKAKEEDDPEDVPADETLARQRAKENGKELKLARNVIKDKDLEITRRDTRISELERENSDLKKVRTDPKDDPEYRALHSQILDDVEESAELIHGVRNVRKSFGTLVTMYDKAKSSEDRTEKMGELKAKIFETCVKTDVEYADLDATEQRDADEKVLKVIQILRHNSPKVAKAIELATKLEGDAEETGFVVREREYSKSVEALKPKVDGFGTLADDIIEASPYKVESMVAKLIKENPRAAARAEKAKKDVLELLTGLRPLTKDEVKKIKSEGGDVAAFERDRQAAHEAKRTKLAAHLFQSLMIRGDIPAMAEELAKLKGKKDDEDEEVDTVLAVTNKRRKPLNKTRKAEPVSKSARERLYGGDEDDD